LCPLTKTGKYWKRENILFGVQTELANALDHE
jgi:hypothetical protein